MKVSKNFSRYEFECQCGCGFAAADVTLLEALEDARAHFKKTYTNRKVIISVTSGNRCHKHNRKVGGAADSHHVKGMAADFVVNNVHADEVADYLEDKYPDRFGIGRYNDRTHLDSRTKPARWDLR